jgi:salicylate synthetase
VWHIGIGNHGSLSIDSTGTSATTWRVGQREELPIAGGSFSEVASCFVAEYSHHNGKMFGWVGFNYGAHIRGLSYSPGKWPLLNIMVPITEVTFGTSEIIVKSYNEAHVDDIRDFISTGAQEVGVHRKLVPKDLHLTTMKHLC